MRIGSLVVDPPVVLAPMAGVTDAPFRLTCAAQGGGLYVSEMLSARGLVEGGAKSWSMARHHPDERVRSLQLYGSEPETVGAAVNRLVRAELVDHLDLNFGCPVAKVMRNGGGAALPVKRRLFAHVVRAAVTAAGDVPVTVKMRMGLDDERLTYLEAGRVAAAEGVAAVALHARTVEQGYAGVARWDAITRLKEAVSDVADVPVLGNGDIWDATDAAAMMTTTGCDGVVVGRGCLGRPWLFGDLAWMLGGKASPRPGGPANGPSSQTSTGDLPVAIGPPVLGPVCTIARQHLQLALDWYGDEITTLRRFRKHLRWYLQGYPVGRDVHAQAGLVTRADDVDALLTDLDPTLAVVPSAVRAPRGRTGGVGRMALPEGWCDDPDADVRVAEPVGAISGG